MGKARVVAVYGIVVAVSLSFAWGFQIDPWRTRSWLGLSGAPSLLIALLLGALLGVLTVAASRSLLRHAAWARALHEELRPAVRGADDRTLLVTALASSVGEEVLFRGLLLPALGVLLSSLAFGLVHQVRGRARWAWVAWATAMGLLFAATYRASGSLLAPLVAHAWVNGVNLRRLRDAPAAAPLRRLGQPLGPADSRREVHRGGDDRAVSRCCRSSSARRGRGA